MIRYLLLIIGFVIGYSAHAQEEGSLPLTLGFSYSPKNLPVVAAEPNVLWLDGSINYYPGYDLNLYQRWTGDLGVSVEVIQLLSTYREHMQYYNMTCNPGEVCSWEYDGKKTVLGLGLGAGYFFRDDKRFSFGPKFSFLYARIVHSNSYSTRNIADGQGFTYPEIIYDPKRVKCKGQLWARVGVEFTYKVSDQFSITLSPGIEHGSARINCYHYSSISIQKTELRLPVGVQYRF
jgi:hypothetical protein